MYFRECSRNTSARDIEYLIFRLVVGCFCYLAFIDLQDGSIGKRQGTFQGKRITLGAICQHIHDTATIHFQGSAKRQSPTVDERVAHLQRSILIDGGGSCKRTATCLDSTRANIDSARTRVLTIND